MWIFTRDGFFSVAATKYCGAGEVAVRAKKLEHLENIVKRHGITQAILHFPDTDYPYRVQLPLGVWSGIMAREAESVDYSSFLEAASKGGATADYLRALFGAWAVVSKIAPDALPPEER